MSTRASRSSSRIAMLTGSQDDYTFEIWVSVNGEKLPVLAAKSGKDRVPEGWIASREDEVCSITLPCAIETNVVSWSFSFR